LHVALVTQTLGAAGAERQIAHLADGLASLDHDVTLLVLGRAPVEDRTALERAGVDVVELGAVTPKLRARAMGRVVSVLRASQVVVCSSWDATFWGRIGAIIARRPVLVIEHAVYRARQTSLGGKPRGKWIAVHNRLLDPLTYATVACASAQLPVLRSEGVAERKIVLIRNGVPVDAIRAAAAAGGDRAAFGIPAEAKVLVHVARLTGLKNQRQTIASAATLRAEGLDVHVVLLGGGEDREALERQARERPWLHVLGVRDDVANVFGLGDVAVLPSLAEAMPMIVAEAFAAGLPVVGYDVGDVGPILRETRAGRAVPAEDSDAFTEACRALLTDPQALAEAAARAREAAQGFDATLMARRYAALLAAAVQRRAPHDAEPVLDLESRVTSAPPPV
jgi:glycosyltransferase involved in cell wall biosynthesis